MKHYDDLLQRLRSATKLPTLQSLCNEAAEAIEELQKCGMLNSRGFCSLTACRYPSNAIVVEPKVIRGMMVNPQIEKPQTNADRIRMMSDEELAEVVNDLFYGLHEDPGMCDMCDQYSIQNCKRCWLDWLKEEAK